MSEKYEHYSMYFQWVVNDNEYLVTVHELPGCKATGKTYEEAIQHAKVAIKQWIDEQEVAGNPIPAARLYDSR